MTTKEKTNTSGAMRVFALGGLHEYGKNMWVFEGNDEILVVDAGILFPGYDQPGIDYVMPDFSYLVEKAKNIQALVLTSPHEAHSGCAEHLIRKCNIKKVIGSKE